MKAIGVRHMTRPVFQLRLNADRRGMSISEMLGMVSWALRGRWKVFAGYEGRSWRCHCLHVIYKAGKGLVTVLAEGRELETTVTKYKLAVKDII